MADFLTRGEKIIVALAVAIAAGFVGFFIWLLLTFMHYFGVI